MQTLVIYVVIIILFLIIAITVFNITKSAIREKRISDFSLSKSDLDDESIIEKISKTFWSFIHFLSKNLGKSRILEVLSKDYEKYIMTKEENYKNTLDYITIKILVTILSIVVVTILMILKLIPDNYIILALAIIIGFIFPDIIWSINYVNKCHKISNRLYESVIIIADSLPRCSIEEGISKVINELDGPIQDEYKKILIDLTYNINIADAFKRFYKRTKIKEIKTIYHILDINDENLIESFNLIRTEFDFINEKNNITSNINSLLNVLSYIYLLVPLILVLMILIINPNYFLIIKNYASGSIYLALIIVIYIMLIVSVRKIMGDRK